MRSMGNYDLLLDIVLLVFSFAAMHVISERYFIESLDFLSKKLRLSSDMAGSTLMAAGSSAPELAVALVSILMAGHHEAIGVGTIVGSALFNILVISGAVMYISRSAKLVWQPIVRDIIFYIIAIILLGYVFHSGGVTLLTGILLVLAYFVYVVFVYFWKRIKNYDDNEDEPVKKQISKPFLIDLLASRFQILTFFVSIGLISLLSWLLVHSAIGISEAMGVPELIIGITVVAIGTSVPDLISSVIVTKQGRPGMAINNAIGSNTFDILIGLGLPFLLFALIKNEEIVLEAQNLIVSISILLGSSVVLLIFFLLNTWKTSRKMGIFLVLLYILYLGYIVCTNNC